MKKKKGIILAIIVIAVAAIAGVGIYFLKKNSEPDLKAEENVIDDNYRMYYEVFVYSFCDSDGDGVGDIQGLISKLDYIEDLGCNGIWLMPIMPSTTYHKYDVTDYYDIDPEYGTLDDFKMLIEECDKRNINVIIDMVFNHTSTKHQWFIEATEYLQGLEEGEEPDLTVCPYVDYYNFQKEVPNTTTYHQVEGTDWYYECVFWDQMPDLNLANEDLRRDLEDIADYWLELGVSGFRLDAAKEYYTGSSEKNIEVLSWYTDYVKSVDADTYIVAEVWDSYSTIKKYYTSGVPSIFDYTYGNNDGLIIKTLQRAGNGEAGNKLAQNFVITQNEYYENNPDMINAPFLSNHDTGRIAGFVGNKQEKIKMAGAMNILMSGSAFLYYGEELGMSGSGIDENKRAPMYWSSDSEAEGMTDGPKAMEEVTHNFPSLEEQQEDEYSIYNYYKQVIHIRNKYPEVARGTVTVMDQIEDGDLTAISKTYEDSTIYIIYNVSDETKQVTVSKTDYSYEDLTDALTVGEEEVTLEEETLTLPPYSIAILK